MGEVAALVTLAGLLWCAATSLQTGHPPRLLRPVADWVSARLGRVRPASEPLPPVLLGLELRRMSEQVRRVEAGNQPSPAERLAVCNLAYDLVLRDYCRSVGIPVPAGRGPLSRDQRFAMESALISAGHDW